MVSEEEGDKVDKWESEQVKTLDGFYFATDISQ